MAVTPQGDRAVSASEDRTVDDLSPVRALQRLEGLDCSGTFPRKGKLSDLTPLRGMRLKHLSLCSTQVADLSPLRGMPLTELVAGDTRISDLSRLAA